MKALNILDRPEQFDLLEDDKKEILLSWIRDNLEPRKAFNEYHSSYGLKHIVEHMTGQYYYNGAFKGAMLKAGYTPKRELDQNWIFAISEKSPGLIEQRQSYPHSVKKY